MAFKSYREASKTNWGTSDEGMNLNQIQTGCLLRIADASEAMAKNHIKLQEDYDYMRKERDRYRERYEESQNSIRSLKGVITKLRKKLAK